ncbi:MAG: hypothetical protein N3B12_06805 [Armatimonadetes bacterium]|nr:hypothetical protein [Armatimonadota bacterium]
MGMPAILRNSEYRGIAILVLAIATTAFLLAVATGKIELFSGPRLLDKIIFVSESTGSAEIWAINPDGSGRIRLTTGANVRSAPYISPKGDRIICVGRFGRSDQIFSIGARGGEPNWLTSSTGPKKEPQYTPDGKKLSFISSGRVFVADKNGDNLRPILPTAFEMREALSNPLTHGETPLYRSYVWAPDSESIVGIRRDSEGNESIVCLIAHNPVPFIMPAPGTIWASLLNELLEQEGKMRRRITPDERVVLTGLTWAAPVKGFAVSVVCGKDGFLMIFSTQKKRLRLIGFKSFKDRKIGPATFAPDGSAIIIPMIFGKPGYNPGLIRIDLADGRVEVVASGLFEEISYSPAGDKILATLSDEVKGRRDVVLIDPASGRTNLLTQDGHSYHAVWTPSSTGIHTSDSHEHHDH